MSLYRESSAHLSDWVKKPLAIFSTNQKFSERKLIVLLTRFPASWIRFDMWLVRLFDCTCQDWLLGFSNQTLNIENRSFYVFYINVFLSFNNCPSLDVCEVHPKKLRKKPFNDLAGSVDSGSQNIEPASIVLTTLWFEAVVYFVHHSKVFVYIIFVILLIYYENSSSKNFFILFLYTIPESLCTNRELPKLIGLFYNVKIH